MEESASSSYMSVTVSTETECYISTFEEAKSSSKTSVIFNISTQ
jgi:hypothetical protein